MKEIEIYNCNNELVRKFIPCVRNEDNKIGMYDYITKNFYTNQGTGEFLKGEDVNMWLGDKTDDDKYIVPLKITTSSGEISTTITLNAPLRKIDNTADYIDLKNKKVVRYICEDGTILNAPTEESIEIDNLPNINEIINILVETEVAPSRIENR